MLPLQVPSLEVITSAGCITTTPASPAARVSQIIDFNQAITECRKRSSWQTAISLLQEASARSAQPNIISYNACMSVCERAEQWTPVRQLLDDAKHRQLHPTDVTYNTVICATRASGQWQWVLHFMQEMVSNQVPCDTITYNTSISACGHLACWQMALLLLQTASNQLATNLITFNASISACERAGQWQAALCVLKSAQQQRMESDIVTYNTAASACGRAARWQQVLHLVDEVSSRQMRLDVVTYNTAINACCDSWILSLQILRQLAKMEVQATLVSYNSAIAACRADGHWELAIWMLQESAEQQLYPNTISYSSAISACEVSGQWDLAMQLLARMSSNSLEINLVTLCALISVCGVASEWQRAFSVYNGIQKTQMTTFALNIMMHALGSGESGGQWEGALRLLVEMSRDLKLDSITYSSALAACGDARAWLQALELCADARSQSLELNVGTINAGLRAFRGTETWPVALCIRSELSEKLGPGPVQVMTNSLIGACSEASAWACALRAFEAHPEGDADAISFNAALSACRRTGEWQQALWLFVQSRARAIQLDMTSYNLVISTSAKQREWEMSLAAQEELRASCPQTGFFNSNHIIYACAECSSWPVAISVFAENHKALLSDTACSPTDKEACGKAEGSEAAEQAEATPLQTSFAALQTGLDYAGQWHQIIHLWTRLNAMRLLTAKFMYISAFAAQWSHSKQQGLRLLDQMRQTRLQASPEAYDSAIQQLLRSQKRSVGFRSPRVCPVDLCFVVVVVRAYCLVR